MAKISSQVHETLANRLDEACTREDGIPGVVFTAVNKKGELIFKHAAGKRGAGSKEPMTLDSVFWIASCTKMITGIACMQLVEKGKLELDNADQVEQIAPELKTIKVLQEKTPGEYVLVDREKRITLRMLLNHTAGFGYTLVNEKLNNWARPIGINDITSFPSDYLKAPLVNQPGTRFEYGISIDWAGILVMRVSGLSLDDYFRKFIFDPLEIKKLSFFPDSCMKKNLAYMHHREHDGTYRVIDQPLHQQLIAETPDEIKATFNAGGAGCFAQPSEYCKIIAMLLNDGTCPTTNQQILKPETVEEMFSNQIPEFPDFGRQYMPAARPYYTNQLPDLYPQEGQQGWGLTFFYHCRDGLTGRKKGTGWWMGMANSFWWADRESGLGGMITSQILPFGDMNVVGLWSEIETALYQAIS